MANLTITNQNIAAPTAPVTRPSAPPAAQTDSKDSNSNSVYHHVSAAQSFLSHYTSGIGSFFHKAEDTVEHVGTTIKNDANGVAQGVHGVYNKFFGKNPRQESTTKYGELGLINPNGNGNASYKALDESGKTSPNGNDIPAAAVKNKNVVVLFQGINGSNFSYTNTMGKYLDSSKDKVDLDQPILSIHEGDRPDTADEVGTIVKDWTHMKSVEAGGDADLSQSFKDDPAVQTGYNVLKQALDAGDHVTVLAHSGGGAESAETLNLLKSQGYGDKIKQDVKYVSIAGAASAQDAVDAGVKSSQALYLGTNQDAVSQFGHAYVDPKNPVGGAIGLAKALSNATDWNLGTPHSPETIIPGGIDHLEDVIDNGQGGGTYLSDTNQDVGSKFHDYLR